MFGKLIFDSNRSFQVRSAHAEQRVNGPDGDKLCRQRSKDAACFLYCMAACPCGSSQQGLML